jgi:4-hydroxybenzoate polyprenyltransferase
MAVLFSLCLVIGFGLGAAVNGTFLIYAFAYVIITACYSLFLKNIPYVDSLTIVSGFIVRAFAGGAIVNVAISHWLLLMLVCITIFLAFAKRKTEVHLYLEKQIAGRKVIGFYNLKFTNLIVIISSILSVVVYVLYTTDKKIIAQFGTAKLFWTAFPVFIGIARYNYLLFKTDRAANPAKMFLTDAILCITFVSWISIFGILIYG